MGLRTTVGREALLRLVEDADVLLENFRPGVMARLGLEVQTLHARNPRLIVCSISGFGADGPRTLVEFGDRCLEIDVPEHAAVVEFDDPGGLSEFDSLT